MPLLQRDQRAATGRCQSPTQLLRDDRRALLATAACSPATTVFAAAASTDSAASAASQPAPISATIASSSSGSPAAAAGARAAGRLLASAAGCPAVPVVASNGATFAVAAATVGAAAVRPHRVSQEHRLRRGRRVRDEHDSQRRGGARQVQPEGRRAIRDSYDCFIRDYVLFYFYFLRNYGGCYYGHYAWPLRVCQAGAAASEPGWHVHLRDDGVACSQQQPLRGLLPVRRLHCLLRGRMPAALRAPAAVVSAADSTDVPVRSDACGRWRRQQHHKHLHRSQRADAAAAALAGGPAITTLVAAATSGARAAGWLLASASGAAASAPRVAAVAR